LRQHVHAVHIQAGKSIVNYTDMAHSLNENDGWSLAANTKLPVRVQVTVD
jgi:hypothetical protein